MSDEQQTYPVSECCYRLRPRISKTCSFQATASTSRHHDLTHCETSGEQTSEQQSHDCLQWFCVTVMETEVSATDIAGRKSRIFSLGATIEAELHKLTAKKMTIVKITPLLWIQVSLSDRKRLTWRQETHFFLVKKKKCPMLVPLAKALLRACATSACRGSAFQQLWTLICQSCQVAADILSFLSNSATDILWQ